MNKSTVISLSAACAVGLLATTLARKAHAEHFDMLLHVVAGTEQADAFMDTTPPLGGINKRPVVKLKAGDKVDVLWRMKNVFPHGILKGVTIHFFVVKEEQLGQKPVPDPSGPGGIVDNSFVMDFAPNAPARGALHFRINDPGNYLVRVQSEDTHQESGHEHFSAIDLQVQ